MLARLTDAAQQLLDQAQLLLQGQPSRFIKDITIQHISVLLLHSRRIHSAAFYANVLKWAILLNTVLSSRTSVSLIRPARLVSAATPSPPPTPPRSFPARDVI